MRTRSVSFRRSTRMKALGCSLLLCCVFLALGPARGQEPGQTPRPTVTDPLREPSEEELVRLYKELPQFALVKDNAPFVYASKRQMDVKVLQDADAEEKAYDYVLGFARRQPAERLKKYSNKNVPIENLFHDIRKDYLRELIHIEGNLSLILAMKPTDELKTLQGVEQLYEAWIFPNGSSKLVCVVVSELPEGVQPGENQYLRVAFDAYYFKLWHYETRKKLDGAKDPDKHEWHAAPLFLGKTIEVLGPVEAEPTLSSGMAIGLVGGLVALGLVAVGIGLWFRRGDKHIRAAARNKIESTAVFENNPEPPAGPVNRIADQF